MRYYKQVYKSYIIAIGIGYGHDEIPKDEYDDIMTAIKNCPIANDGIIYMLKEDLTWEVAGTQTESNIHMLSDNSVTNQ